jgi:hypothetical protein
MACRSNPRLVDDTEGSEATHSTPVEGEEAEGWEAIIPGLVVGTG